MLSDTKLRNLKPREADYKIADRDGLYVLVTKAGSVSFRFNYRLHGRQETLVLGRYGSGGLTLLEAREKLSEARKKLSMSESPARLKSRREQMIGEQEDFSIWASRWLEKYKMAESTRDMRRSVYLRDLARPLGKLLLPEITHSELRVLCDRIVERGAPATAVHAREIVMQVFEYARQRGIEVENPADKVVPSSIARFVPRDRSLTPAEIQLVYQFIEHVSCAAPLRLAIKLLLLTLLRKSELAEATWSEIDFGNALWTIPAARMKRRNPHNVYLSSQALEILMALKICPGGSDYIFPSRYDPDQPISQATLNRIVYAIEEQARGHGRELASFTVHDLRRTGSTLLHEAGFNSDWIEKCLAHEQRGVRAVYNKAEYATQRREMLQQWADMVDGWVSVAGRC